MPGVVSTSTTSEDGIDACLLFGHAIGEIYRPVAKSTEDLRGLVSFMR
jgi:hypothetical protein